MQPSASDNHVYSLGEHLVLLTAVVKDGMIVFPVLQVVQRNRNTNHKGGFKAAAHDVTDMIRLWRFFQQKHAAKIRKSSRLKDSKMYAASLGISVDFNFAFCIHVDHIDGKK